MCVCEGEGGLNILKDLSWNSHLINEIIIQSNQT